MSPEDIEKRFAYHPPTTEAKRTAHANVRSAFRRLAEELNVLLPEGREKALVMTQVEQVMFWANAAVARQT